jgi:FAD/FMN-containing dehydrogenase
VPHTPRPHELARELPSALLRDLTAVIGPQHVLTGDAAAGYAVDWTGRFRGDPPAVLRPRDTEQVAALLRLCSGAGVPVVPQGGNTGLVGGSVPLHGELVLDLRRLDALGAVDRRSGQITAQAGVTLARLQRHADDSGWRYGVDLAARDVATVGGTIATNAGGVHVLRFGATRQQVVGVEAVFADGRVVRRLDGLEKDNTGYDLAGLLCGSEGTLAVVTSARVRLHPRPAFTVVALLAFDDIDAALDAVGELRRGIDCVQAIELFFESGLALVCDRLGLARPFRTKHTAYVLVEAAAMTDPTVALSVQVEQLVDLGDVAVATDAAAARALWRYREAHTEAINLLGAPHKLDVALPAENLATFIRNVSDEVVAVAPGAKVWLFGHAGDGNIHVNVTGIAPDDEGVTRAVLQLVTGLHGSISAEHGIGTAKRQYLDLVRSADEISVYRTIKHALDPADILNPHVVLPSVSGAADRAAVPER